MKRDDGEFILEGIKKEAIDIYNIDKNTSHESIKSYCILYNDHSTEA
jgi:hypothetical protein